MPKEKSSGFVTARSSAAKSRRARRTYLDRIARDLEVIRSQAQEHLCRVVEGQQGGGGERLRATGIPQTPVVQERDERKPR